MTEERSPPYETGSEARPSSKHRWRGRLFSAEGKFGRNVGDQESTDNDVAKFLYPTAPNARARHQPGDIAPRIDTNVAAHSAIVNEESSSSSIVDVYRGPKPRQNKGLHVTFETASPEIIGEGGDEADLPPIKLAKSLPYASPNTHTGKLPPNTTKDVDEAGGETSTVPIDDPNFRRASLQRVPTGLSDISHEDSMKNQHEQSENSSFQFSRTSLPTSKLPPQYVHSTPLVQEQQYNSSTTSLEETYLNVSPLTEKIFDFERGSPSAEIAKLGGKGHATSENLRLPSPEVVNGDSRASSVSPPPYSDDLQSRSSRQKPLPPMPGVATTTKSAAIKQIDRSQAALHAPPLSQNKVFSLRNVAKSLGDDSLDEFDARVQRFTNIFWLGVSTHTEVMVVPFVQWIRTACWWFLKGRQGLESEVRSRQDVATESGPSPTLKQAYVNLAKAWWIVKEITPNHPEIARFGKASMDSLCAMIRSFGNQSLAEQAGVHVEIIANMRALAMSMKRNGKLPPSDLEIQRLDLHILLELPRLPPDVAPLMVNNNLRPRTDVRPKIAAPFFPFPIGDNERHFNFGRMFVETIFLDNARNEVGVPCVVSVLRDRGEWGVRAVVASQDDQINLVISDEMVGALTWKTVHWKIQAHEMWVTISENAEMKVKLSDKDFKTLWGICDYTTNIRKGFSARRDEELVFERTLQDFQCDDTAHFPSESVPDCRLRVFERKSPMSNRENHCSTHKGYRLTVVSPPSVKTLSSINYDLGRENPVLFGIQRRKEGSRLVLRVLPSSIRLSPAFIEAKDLDLFRHLLSGTLASKEDYRFPALQLQSFDVARSPIHQDPIGLGDNSHTVTLPWTKLRVINKGPPPYGHETLRTVNSEHLRVLVDSDFGTLTDRINLPPGDLQLGLSVENFNEMRLLRPPQSDMTWSLADERIPKKELDSVCMTLKIMLTFTTIRTYHFRSLEDLHKFQSMVTGFSVLFDGLACNFAISRRRMVVPVYKKWETSSARLQVIKQDKTVELVGFFKDFNHGSCMNFVLKVTDVFESFTKAGMFFLRIADAKFALPKGPEVAGMDYLCLDTPEYPSEHDDITIGFDNEHGTVSGSNALSIVLILNMSQTGIDSGKHCRRKSTKCREWHRYDGKRRRYGWRSIWRRYLWPEICIAWCLADTPNLQLRTLNWSRASFLQLALRGNSRESEGKV